MKNLNAKIVIGNTPLALKEFERFKPLFDSWLIKQVEATINADLRIVFGWDWSILREARKDIDEAGAVVPIFWIKAGNPESKWMLLNDLSEIEDLDHIYSLISESLSERFNYLESKIKFSSWEEIFEYSFNDISIIRAKAQTAASDVFLDGKLVFKRAMWDWFIISTPQGSTAYARAAWWVVVPALNTMQITWNNSSFANLVLENTSKIKLIILESEKRPQLIEIDWNRIEQGIEEVSIETSKKYSLLKFISWISFRDKMIRQALKIVK